MKLITMEPKYNHAVVSLAPDKFSSCTSDGKVEWKSDATDLPTEVEIQAELTRLLTEWTAQEYARSRKAEYPDMGSQLNKIYDDGVTKWKSELVDPIKAKWPKDNSGPV